MIFRSSSRRFIVLIGCALASGLLLFLALTGETDAELALAGQAAAGKLHGWSGTLKNKSTYSNPNGPLTTWEETTTVEVNDDHVTSATENEWRQEDLKFTIVGKATGPGSCPHPDGTSTPFTWTQTTYETGVTAARVHLADRVGGGDVVDTDYFGGHPVIKETDSCPTADGGWGYASNHGVNWVDFNGGDLDRTRLAGINDYPSENESTGERNDSTSTVSLSRKLDKVTLTVITTRGEEARVHVTSSPEGIDCPRKCSHVYERGTTVQLTGDSFGGGGQCPELGWLNTQLRGFGLAPLLICQPAVSFSGGGCKLLALGPTADPTCSVTLDESKTVQVRSQWIIGRPRLTVFSKNEAIRTANQIYDGIAKNIPLPPSAVGGTDALKALAGELGKLAMDPPNHQFRRFPDPPRLDALDLSAVPVSATARRRLGALGHAMQRAGNYVRLVRTSIERAEGARIAGKRKFERRQMSAAARWAREQADASTAVNGLRRRVLSAIDWIPPDALAAEVPTALSGTAATLKGQQLTGGLRGFAKRMRKFAHFAKAHPFQTAPGWKRYTWKK